MQIPLTPLSSLEPSVAAPVTNEMWSKMLQIEGLIRANKTAIASNAVKTDHVSDALISVMETMAEIKLLLPTSSTTSTTALQNPIDEVYQFPMETQEALDKLEEDLNSNPELRGKLVSNN